MLQFLEIFSLLANFALISNNLLKIFCLAIIIKFSLFDKVINFNNSIESSTKISLSVFSIKFNKLLGKPFLTKLLKSFEFLFDNKIIVFIIESFSCSSYKFLRNNFINDCK